MAKNANLGAAKNAKNDEFYTRLRDKYKDVLNEKELQLCCLFKADFSTKEINMLTRQSLQTIY